MYFPGADAVLIYGVLFNHYADASLLTFLKPGQTLKDWVRDAGLSDTFEVLSINFDRQTILGVKDMIHTATDGDAYTPDLTVDEAAEAKFLEALRAVGILDLTPSWTLALDATWAECHCH